MTIPEKYICDFCGKEIEQNSPYRRISTPVFTDVDWSDGRFYPKDGSIGRATYDFCASCFKKTITVRAGYQGNKPYFRYGALSSPIAFCPFCKSEELGYDKRLNLYTCKDCKKNFFVFEDGKEN